MKPINSISNKFPSPSKFIKIDNSKIHYIEAGKGDPILFLHGIPTSNYLWRNIIPTLAPYARCIAPDLIGMGKSDKPKIKYTISQHIKYIEKFIKALDLKNVTLVLHGWGSIIGFDYLCRHVKNVKALAFYESHIGPFQWENLSLPIQQLASLLKNRKRKESYQAVVEENYLLNKLFLKANLRKLTAKELSYYQAPFAMPKDRKLLWQYVSEVPFINPKSKASLLVKRYNKKLQRLKCPKLLLYTIPGFMTTISHVEWCRDHLNNLSIADLGEGLHFVQEYNPQNFNNALLNWYQQKVLKS